MCSRKSSEVDVARTGRVRIRQRGWGTAKGLRQSMGPHPYDGQDRGSALPRSAPGIRLPVARKRRGAAPRNQRVVGARGYSNHVDLPPHHKHQSDAGGRAVGARQPTKTAETNTEREGASSSVNATAARRRQRHGQLTQRHVEARKGRENIPGLFFGSAPTMKRREEMARNPENGHGVT